MPASAIAYEHITFDADANPVFFRTGFKAMTIVREHVAYGWGAEELGLNHPQLTLGEVYSALAWYADHAAEVNARLDAELQRADDAHAKQSSASPFKRVLAGASCGSYRFVSSIPNGIDHRDIAKPSANDVLL